MATAPLRRSAPRFLPLLCFGMISITIDADQSSVSLLVRNEAKSPFQLLWIDPDTAAEEVMSYDGGVLPGSDFSFESWPGHEFHIVELPLDGERADCRNQGHGVCRQARFRTQGSSRQSIRVTPDFEAVLVADDPDAEVNSQALVDRCRQLVRERLAGEIASAAGNGNSTTSHEMIKRALDDLGKCVEDRFIPVVERLNSDLSEQMRLRTEMSNHMENCTCLDPALNSSSDDVYNVTWVNQGKEHVVHVKLNRPASRIHVIDNFISEEECRAVERGTVSRLARAIIADGKGGVTHLSARRSLQAIIHVNWTREVEGDPTATLLRRVYNYTNHVLGLNISERGQEPPAVIQYDGRGREDDAPDHYAPHCDGDCNGRPFKSGERVSTTLMFCSIPDDGGHTNFANAFVNVKPKLGSALFFSYIDPARKGMDPGYTQHSGCPVFEGTKRVMLQVIRYGVDDDLPWNSWNSLGVRHSEALEYDAE